MRASGMLRFRRLAHAHARARSVWKLVSMLEIRETLPRGCMRIRDSTRILEGDIMLAVEYIRATDH